MEKWFDMLLYDMIDILLAGWCGCIVLEWLNEEMPEYMEADTYRHEEMSFTMN